jgi:hypothetical protein
MENRSSDNRFRPRRRPSVANDTLLLFPTPSEEGSPENEVELTPVATRAEFVELARAMVENPLRSRHLNTITEDSKPLVQKNAFHPMEEILYPTRYDPNEFAEERTYQGKVDKDRECENLKTAQSKSNKQYISSYQPPIESFNYSPGVVWKQCPGRISFETDAEKVRNKTSDSLADTLTLTPRPIPHNPYSHFAQPLDSRPKRQSMEPVKRSSKHLTSTSGQSFGPDGLIVPEIKPQVNENYLEVPRPKLRNIVFQPPASKIEPERTGLPNHSFFSQNSNSNSAGTQRK